MKFVPALWASTGPKKLRFSVRLLRRYVLWLNMQRLTEEEVFELIDSLDREIIEFERIRPHNKGEIRRKDSMDSAAFKKMIAESIEEEHQPGGDIELYIPSVSKVLVGHHDGIYWLD